MKYSIYKPSSQDIHIDGLQLRSENPLVQLDFGGIAKGYAVDLAIGICRIWVSPTPS